MTSLLLPKPIKSLKVPPKRLARGKRPNKQRKTSLAALKRKLGGPGGLVSRYVLERDRRVCVTCGAPADQAGHFYSRWIGSTWIDPKNLGAQCSRCNLFLHGNPGAFADYIVKTYGPAELERLTVRACRVTKKWEADELQRLIRAIQESGEAFECAYYENNL